MASLLRSSYLCHFSQPAHDRVLYKAVTKRPIRAIVELGIGFGGRTQRLLEVAAWRSECLPLRYTGIDLFEGRSSRGAGVPPAITPASSAQPLTLKQAFRQFRFPHVRVQLVPGDPGSALSRVANSLVGTDLLLLSADHDREAIDQAWSWMPRMLTPQSLVFIEESIAQSGAKPALQWRPLPVGEIQRLAASHRPRWQAA